MGRLTLASISVIVADDLENGDAHIGDDVPGADDDEEEELEEDDDNDGFVYGAIHAGKFG